MKRKKSFKSVMIIGAAIFSMLVSCKGNKQMEPVVPSSETSVKVPEFNADSAYGSIVEQCAFGPRVCETEAHEKCGQYIMRKFQQYGMKVTRQEAEFTRYDGVRMKGYNIIAESGSQTGERLLLAAHWDSRPWADHDVIPDNHRKPVEAANDGASGVAVMLELARVISHESPNVSVDFVCFDAEDAGAPEWEEEQVGDEETWCLGSQYWAHNPHNTNYRYGILLDMVGGQGARFFQEIYSKRYASNLVERVWAAAREAGYSSFFPKVEAGCVMDDHVPVNQIAKIPMIDIIPYYPNGTSSFGPTWHTTHDTPENIDPGTLKAVGQTLLQFIYQNP